MKVDGEEAKTGPETGTEEKRGESQDGRPCNHSPGAGAEGEAKNAEQWALGLAHPWDMGVAWE